MNPPYDITPAILSLVSSISEKLGVVNALYLNKQTPQLRKQNRIKTIQSSLQIEGNTLSEVQITAIIENKRVIGPEKEILEVMNAIKVYDRIETFKPNSEKHLLMAHKQLMHLLITDAGKYRSKGVGITRGSIVAHVAPPAKQVPGLMKALFSYLKSSKELTLIKSCVFHYEMEFIHPFSDGNGRMGRLWQTLILMSEYPVFEFLPFETLISKTQSGYYQSLSKSDKAGNSSPFIEYMLNVIDQSLANLLNFNSRILTAQDRVEYFVQMGQKEFTRKDYMDIFKELSSATASRDLRLGVELNVFKKSGTNNQVRYSLK